MTKRGETAKKYNYAASCFIFCNHHHHLVFESFDSRPSGSEAERDGKGKEGEERMLEAIIL